MQGSPHILIVDDHREIRDLVSRALTKEGFRVSTAADGRAMRKVLADRRIDLVLLDLMLPGEDGLSLCRAIRAELTLPIVMLTAKGDEVDRVIGLEMGADVRDDVSARKSGGRHEQIYRSRPGSDRVAARGLCSGTGSLRSSSDDGGLSAHGQHGACGKPAVRDLVRFRQVIGSDSAGICRAGRRNDPLRLSTRVHAARLGMLASARKISDRGALEELERQADEVFANAVRKAEAEALDETQLMTFSFGLEYLRQAISERRQRLTDGPLVTAELATVTNLADRKSVVAIAPRGRTELSEP